MTVAFLAGKLVYQSVVAAYSFGWIPKVRRSLLLGLVVLLLGRVVVETISPHLPYEVIVIITICFSVLQSEANVNLRAWVDAAIRRSRKSLRLKKPLGSWEDMLNQSAKAT